MTHIIKSDIGAIRGESKMITIKFSHNYFKLSGDKTAKLLAVFSTHYNQLGKDFTINYTRKRSISCAGEK